MAGYAQRTDLIENPVYGAKAEQQRQVDALAPQAQPGLSLSPRMPTQLDAPSGNPMEPVTAGLDIGAGASSEALGMDPAVLTSATLRQLYQRFPSDSLLRLLKQMEG